MQMFKDPNGNHFNMLSQFCPPVPSFSSFKIVSSPLVFRLFNYSCYFYISPLNLMASPKFSMVKLRANGGTEQLPTLLGQQCWESGSVLAVVYKWLQQVLQQLPTMLKPTVHLGKDTSHKSPTLLR